MIRRKVTVKNPTGLHLRPADMLCKKAMSYDCKVLICFQGSEYNAKSVLSVLGACVKSGDEIEMVCDGKDEEEAIQGIVSIIEEGLGE